MAFEQWYEKRFLDDNASWYQRDIGEDAWNAAKESSKQEIEDLNNRINAMRIMHLNALATRFNEGLRVGHVDMNRTLKDMSVLKNDHRNEIEVLTNIMLDLESILEKRS